MKNDQQLKEPDLRIKSNSFFKPKDLESRERIGLTSKDSVRIAEDHILEKIIHIGLKNTNSMDSPGSAR